MPGRLLALHVENFLGLRDVTVPLGSLTVSVSPPNCSTGTPARLEDTKEELKRGLGLPVFRESDGPSVAREALRHRLVPSPRGTNRSYADLVGDPTGWT